MGLALSKPDIMKTSTQQECWDGLLFGLDLLLGELKATSGPNNNNNISSSHVLITEQALFQQHYIH